MFALVLAATITTGYSIPEPVLRAGPRLTQVFHVKDLPTGSVPWPLADPGARFDNSDMRGDGYPNHGLFLAGCTRDICVLHFQVGGIISPYCMIAMQRQTKNWRPIWYARLSRRLASFEEMQSVLEGGAQIKLSSMNWCNQNGGTITP